MTALLALESTVISHGLPYPQNIETARRLEQIAREHGAEPRTVAVIRGELRAGLDEADLELLARGHDVRKLSRRDLPIAVAKGWNGATTVATTMWIAARHDIRVFSTGGIGGVHRLQVASGRRQVVAQHPGEQSPERAGGAMAADVSADLPELAQTPVAVVCAGAKAILDLPATLEWLETWGVPVVGYGTDEFPAFYSRSSGLPVDVRVDTPKEAAAIVEAKRRLGLPGGVLICAPVPEEFELPAAEANAAIEQALAEADAQGVRGKAITPFLLARIVELTGERSLRANLALLENNVRIGAQIAAALAAAAG
ncbi:MAG TPA: pseudouridine-5'-phosphate glycosidase [Anaerolineae bacterium]|nr:pseudouridine-5'-phosphate glycosidase [Anaerolineae bacterium]